MQLVITKWTYFVQPLPSSRNTICSIPETICFFFLCSAIATILISNRIKFFCPFLNFKETKPCTVYSLCLASFAQEMCSLLHSSPLFEYHSDHHWDCFLFFNKQEYYKQGSLYITNRAVIIFLEKIFGAYIYTIHWNTAKSRIAWPSYVSRIVYRLG